MQALSCLSLKSQLASWDLTSFFVFSTRSGARLANVYDLVADGWHQTGHFMHRHSPMWVDWWEFCTREKLAIHIPTVMRKKYLFANNNHTCRIGTHDCYLQINTSHLLSVLWRCWLGGRKGIRPVKKTEWWGAGMAVCLEQGADLHMAQLMPLPLTVSCFSKIQIGFTFLLTWVVLVKGPLHGCVCVTYLLT